MRPHSRLAPVMAAVPIAGRLAAAADHLDLADREPVERKETATPK